MSIYHFLIGSMLRSLQRHFETSVHWQNSKDTNANRALKIIIHPLHVTLFFGNRIKHFDVLAALFKPFVTTALEELFGFGVIRTHSLALSV